MLEETADTALIPSRWKVGGVFHQVRQEGGFALILGYQLYPWTHGDLAKRVREQLGLPVDTPRVLHDGTMDRFFNWHEKNV